MQNIKRFEFECIVIVGFSFLLERFCSDVCSPDLLRLISLNVSSRNTRTNTSFYVPFHSTNPGFSPVSFALLPPQTNQFKYPSFNLVLRVILKFEFFMLNLGSQMLVWSGR